MSKIVISLGAGHGGVDSGAVGPTGLMEKNVTLGIVLKARDILCATGAFDVRLIRDRDVYVGVRDRGRMAASWGSKCHVEVHCNAFNGKASYMAVWRSCDLPGDAKYADLLSQRIAGVLGVKSIGNQVRYSASQGGGDGADFKHEDYYGVIDAAQDGGVSHVLFPECGFIDFKPTESKLRQPDVIEAIAKAVAETICDIFNVKPASGGKPAANTAGKTIETVKCGSYYVREQPDFNGKILGVIKGGQKFETVPAANGFRKINFNGKTGYAGPGAWSGS